MNSLSLGVLLQRLKNDVVVYTVQCTRVQCTYMRRVSTTWCYILEFGFFLAVVFTFSPPPPPHPLGIFYLHPELQFSVVAEVENAVFVQMNPGIN